MGTIVTEPIRVNLGSMESELTSFWTKALEGSIPGISAPVARVLLSNLLVYASSDEEASEAAGIIEKIAADHPTRAIIADAWKGTQEGSLQADVSMLCSVTERGRRLCGEEIRLHPHGLEAAALGTIMPILVPDLPIYLWTPGDLRSDDEILRQLVHVADHWIIDTRRLTSWTDGFRFAASLAPSHSDQASPMLHDLAWASISDWRELVAEQFDAPPARAYLQGISGVEITYKAREDKRPSVEPVLMAAWLARQLAWQRPRIERAGDGSWTIIAAADGREVTIRLRPAADARPPIDEVLIESDLDGRRGTFRAARAGGADEVSLELAAPDVPKVHRTVQLAPSSRERSLRQVLDSPGRDMVYDRVLPVIEELAAGIQQVSGIEA